MAESSTRGSASIRVDSEVGEGRLAHELCIPAPGLWAHGFQLEAWLHSLKDYGVPGHTIGSSWVPTCGLPNEHASAIAADMDRRAREFEEQHSIYRNPRYVDLAGRLLRARDVTVTVRLAGDLKHELENGDLVGLDECVRVEFDNQALAQLDSWTKMWGARTRSPRPLKHDFLCARAAYSHDILWHDLVTIGRALGLKGTREAQRYSDGRPRFKGLEVVIERGRRIRHDLGHWPWSEFAAGDLSSAWWKNSRSWTAMQLAINRHVARVVADGKHGALYEEQIASLTESVIAVLNGHDSCRQISGDLAPDASVASQARFAFLDGHAWFDAILPITHSRGRSGRERVSEAKCEIDAIVAHGWSRWSAWRISRDQAAYVFKRNEVYSGPAPGTSQASRSLLAAARST